MAIRKAEAEWRGDLINGNGTMKVESGAFECKYSFGTRFGEEPGTNPEELIGAAHAGCFSMALAAILADAGFQPKRIHTKASVSIEKVSGGFAVTKSALQTEADVPGIDEATFFKHANAAKEGCPVSKALAGVEITLEAKLL